jgi:hypothetical protein
VDINVTPWATIQVDGVDLGQTPIAHAPLAPGSHVFRATMPNGDVIERTVRISPETRYVTLSEAPASAGPAQPEASNAPESAPAPQVEPPIPVHINATPWATIEVDGVELGETPIARAPLTPGSHIFHARMPDGRVIERTVQINSETRYLTFQ